MQIIGHCYISKHLSSILIIYSVDDFVKWTLDPVSTSTSNQPPIKQLPPFLHDAGTVPRTKAATTPLEVFQLFFVNVILQNIVKQSLLFASQKGAMLNLLTEDLME